MNMTEKNGQPSMEEILASIRRIIAEEPTTHPHNGELRGTPIVLKGDGALEDTSEFDLPSIFRASPPVTSERQTPLLGRLTDAIRHATSSGQADAHKAANGAGSTADASAGATPSPSAGLSTLKSVRSDLGASAPVNGTSLSAASSDDPPSSPGSNSSQSGAFPSAASNEPTPQRVMVPFKDTHFLRMSAPTGASAPQPTPTPVEPPVQNMAPDFSSIISEVPERPAPFVQPQPAAAPPEAPFTMPPPPPLPSAASPHQPQPGPGTAVSTSSGAPNGSIEDATADLLRPMLRQWLADNMPRMVEKALHIEMAESIKAPKKP